MERGKERGSDQQLDEPADIWDRLGTADPNLAIRGYWMLNECTGSEAIDSSGYGNTGAFQQCIGDLGDCNQADEKFGEWYYGHVDGYQF